MIPRRLPFKFPLLRRPPPALLQAPLQLEAAAPWKQLPCRASSSLRYPITPYSKAKIEGKKMRPHRNWESMSEPRLMPKFLRCAEHTARELGVWDDIADFDE